MSVSVGTIEAVLRLKDEMTAKLDTARGALNAFAKDNTESFAAVGKAVGLATGAITAATGAVIALGIRGSTVNDVATAFATLTRETGSTDAVLATLRTSTDGLVSNFDLMTTTNLAFSQGLRLSQSELQLTGESARVLADRIGGSAADAYGILTAAMATGMDRQLKTIGLNIDATAAMDAYAFSLGKEASALTESEQKLAKRNAILAAMTVELERSGRAELDFSEKIDRAIIGVKNFTDQLGSAIATSPILNAAFDAVGSALSSAFGPNQAQLISSLTKIVGDVAIALVGIGQVGIEIVRFLSDAWNGLKVIFSSVMDILVGGLELIVSGIAAVASAASSLPGVGDQFAGIAATMGEMSIQLNGMRESFKAQTDEALDNAASQNAALDKVSEVLGTVKAAMIAARDAQASTTPVTEALTGATKGMGVSEDELAQKLVATATELRLHKTLTEALMSARLLMSGTATDNAIAGFEKEYQAAVAALDKTSAKYAETMKLLAALRDAKTAAEGSSWATLSAQSQEAMRQMAEAARADYDRMLWSGLHFTRAALQAQLDKTKELEFAANHMGQSYVSATAAASAGMSALTTATATAVQMVRTLSGELITLEERMARQSMGGQFELQGLSQQEIAQQGGVEALREEMRQIEAAYEQFPGRRAGGSGATGVIDAAGWQRMLEEQRRYIVLKATLSHAAIGGAGQIPGVKSASRGGWGEDLGWPLAKVGGGDNITIVNHINGSADEVARKVSDKIIGSLKRSRQFPSA
mgnify:FL=1